MKAFLRITVGIVALLFSIGFIAKSVGIILDGKDFYSWSPSMALGVPMLVGGVGLILNWFDKDDFTYWPF